MKADPQDARTVLALPLDTWRILAVFSVLAVTGPLYIWSMGSTKDADLTELRTRGQSTEGRILRQREERRTNKYGLTITQMVDFAWTVDGQRYQGTERLPRGTRYAKDQPVTVTYLPSNPSEAILDLDQRSPGLMYRIMALCMWALLLAGAAGFAISGYKKRNQPDEVPPVSNP